MTLKTLALLAVAGTTLSAQSANEWKVDNTHTEVTFQVRHFFTPVTGKFDDFSVELAFNPEDLANSHVKAEIQVGSVDTNNEDRDGHLRTPDFFDAATFPTITFESTAIRAGMGENEYIATGDLTIKDVTRTIELPVTLLGIADLPEGMAQRMGVAQVASFEANLNIDRRDFGVGTGGFAETAVIGGDVEIRLLLEAGR